MLFSTSWVQAQQKARGNLLLIHLFLSGMDEYLFAKATAPPFQINGPFATKAEEIQDTCSQTAGKVAGFYRVASTVLMLRYF